MKYEHGIVIMIHLLSYLPLYFFCKKISIFTVGFLLLMQIVGVDLLVLSYIENDFSLVFKAAMIILLPFLMFFLTKDRSMNINGKKYSGFSFYMLLFDTDLKYVLGFFLLSLIINLYFNPLPGLLNYTNLTILGVFLLSIPFCRKINKLKEHDSQG